jgi:DNA uptake protein ComE-like DNA-binding protein
MEAGLDSAELIAAASDKDLLKVPGLGPKTVEKLRGMAISIMEETGEE